MCFSIITIKNIALKDTRWYYKTQKGCDNLDVGLVIKNARLAKGLTQEELGEKVGVKKSAVAKWENGRVSEIKRSNLKMLAEALDIKPTDLFGWDEEIKNDPVAAGAKAADVLLDRDVMELIELYKSFDEGKKKQVKEFMYFLNR